MKGKENESKPPGKRMMSLAKEDIFQAKAQIAIAFSVNEAKE